MKTALIAIGLWLVVSLPLSIFCGRFMRWAAGDAPHRKPQERRSVTPLCLALGAICLLLAACGGGSGSSVPLNSNGDPVVSTVGNNGQNTPGTGPTCAGQGYTGTYPSCTCPLSYQVYTGLNGGCVGNPPPLTCPVGQSLTGYGAQCCPTGDTGDGTQCYAPPPTKCPSNEYGTPPNCQPIPSCSAVVGGYWGGNACECPAGDTGTYPACTVPACPSGDTGTYPNCVAPPACTLPGSYWGGSACECPAGQVGAYPSCFSQSSIVLTLSANMDPTTVVDTSQGVGGNTEAALSWSVSSNVTPDSILCTVNGGDPTLATSTTVGPFTPSQDGSAVQFTVACTDEWKATASAMVVVNVVAPQAPPPDVFTSFDNGDGTYTFNWYSYGQAGCYVELFASGGPYSSGVQLTPGGTVTGSATSAVLSPAYSPYSATLYCAGVPDPSVQSIGVSP